MAVIRAKRLFAAAVPGNVVADLPALTPTIEAHTPELRLVSLYTVPPGKRAILRFISLTTMGPPATGSEPYFTIFLTDVATGQGTLHFHWGGFVSKTAELATWRFNQQWTGTLVMHPGDQLSMNHNASVPIATIGSGHELNEIT